MERRRRLLSNKDSTAASSSGAQSQGLRITLAGTAPTFSSEMFSGKSKSSLPNQVAEEPNSGTSVHEAGDKKLEIIGGASETINAESPPNIPTKIPLGLQKLCSDDNASDQGVAHLQLLSGGSNRHASTRH